LLIKRFIAVQSRELRGDDNLSPYLSVLAYLEFTPTVPGGPFPIHPRTNCSRPHPHYRTSLPPTSNSLLLKPVKVPKYSYATKPRKCNTWEIEQSSANGLPSQERHLVAMSNGSSMPITTSRSDSLMSARGRRNSFLFLLSSIAFTTAGLTQTTSSTPAITPQQGASSPQCYRKIYVKIRDITVVHAVLPTSTLPCSFACAAPGSSKAPAATQNVSRKSSGGGGQK